ncbi:MAG: o-succinylbenzoate synthase [Bacteroidetes bacterium]|nr:o-succinylbenzoate synthase [Bacteroidota bacterium]
MQLSIEPHCLAFSKPATTSRGAYTEKTSWVLRLQKGKIIGLGEASPLAGLSIDYSADYIDILAPEINKIQSEESIRGLLEHWMPGKTCPLPALRFALHCALLDFQSGGSGIWVKNSFTQGKIGLPINGLVWMDNPEAMLKEAKQKIASGFGCIKIKVGSEDFDKECRLLESIRKQFSPFKLELRLDANGSFMPDTTLQQIQDLSRFSIHSIEQPVPAAFGGLDEICHCSTIPIALDEELVGLNFDDGAKRLLWAKPHYIVLKPTLLGGLDLAERWISIAKQYNIGWWSTSALEGSIGLSAIAQWVSQFGSPLCQGLGTGELYTDNFPKRTAMRSNSLWFLP